MPNNPSTKKRLRQDVGRTLRNKIKRSTMRGRVRAVREAVEAGDKGKAQAELVNAYRAIDKCAKHNIIHANNAANKKSSLARMVNGA